MAATCSQCSKKCLHVFVYIVLDVRKYIGQAGERSKFKDLKKIHKFQKFQVKRTRNLQIKFTLKQILSEKRSTRRPLTQWRSIRSTDYSHGLKRAA